MNNPAQTPLTLDDIDLRLEETLADTREGRVEFATFSSGEYVHSILIERARAMQIYRDLGEILGETKTRSTFAERPSLSDREMATILAALRYWQREGQLSGGHELDIAEEGGRLRPLSAIEIDSLCEKLNVSVNTLEN